jgi:hypothetical protein
MAIDKNLELGTPEAAVRSCVELLSMLFEQPVDKTAYYLDLYYQVRRVYEEQRRRNEAAARFLEQFTRPEEPEPNVYPEPRRTMNNPEVPESPAEDTPSQSAAPTAPPGGGARETPERRREEKFLEVLESVNAGAPFCDGRGSRSYGNHNAANAAADKRRIRERLMQMREAGLSTPQILKAGNGCITEEQVRAIIAARPVPVAVFRVLDGVLETLAGAAPET